VEPRRDRAVGLAPAHAAAAAGCKAAAPVPADWLRLARLARALSWITLAWMGVEGAVAIGAAVFAGLAANTLWGAWWLDGVVALGIACWAVVEGRRAWAGQSCGCAPQPGLPC